MDEREQMVERYCPWCTKGCLPATHALSRICREHAEVLRAEFTARRASRRAASLASHPKRLMLDFGTFAVN